jgi:hypothetical protein
MAYAMAVQNGNEKEMDCHQCVCIGFVGAVMLGVMILAFSALIGFPALLVAAIVWIAIVLCGHDKKNWATPYIVLAAGIVVIFISGS